MPKTLLIQVAALGHEFLRTHSPSARMAELQFRSIRSVFPALTCSVQATMRTARPPASHGMVGNGFFSREFGRPFFWEQSASLVQGPRIWDAFRAAGHTVGVLFWQQSLGPQADLILSPAPIHKHHGGMIQDCFSRPAGLYERLCQSIGRPFNLAHYWGPRAGLKSSTWITRATAQVMDDPAPDLLLSYLPHLDYDLQRHGPDSPAATEAIDSLEECLIDLLAAAQRSGYRVLVFGDYAISPVSRPIHPNRILREAGLFHTRLVKKMNYADLHTSAAFAVVDHQIAHVITHNQPTREQVRELFENTEGVRTVLGSEKKARMDIDHPRAGDLILTADPDAWFAYPWWTGEEKPPDYATHVDIHNKPGYDPGELFWGFWPLSTSTDQSRIRGSHGLTGLSGTAATWASTFPLPQDPETFIDLAEMLGEMLCRHASS
jgi:predicted AlkP superfamily pyrophosphatase or phosphodiesterase